MDNRVGVPFLLRLVDQLLGEFIERNKWPEQKRTVTACIQDGPDNAHTHTHIHIHPVARTHRPILAQATQHNTTQQQQQKCNISIDLYIICSWFYCVAMVFMGILTFIFGSLAAYLCFFFTGKFLRLITAFSLSVLCCFSLLLAVSFVCPFVERGSAFIIVRAGVCAR